MNYFEQQLKNAKTKAEQSFWDKHLWQMNTDTFSKEMRCGVVEIPNDDYHKGYGYSASQIKKAVQCSANFFRYEPSKKLEAFDYGNYFELMLLEPAKYNADIMHNKVVVFDEADRPEPTKSFASKLNKEWKQEIYDNADLVVTKDVHEECKAIVDSLQGNPKFMELLDGLKVQQSYYWLDSQTELLCKTRPDMVTETSEGTILTDVKTTADGSPNGFAKQFSNLLYGIQAATQVDGYEDATGNKVIKYQYLVVEKGTGNVAFYELSADDIAFYRNVYKRCLVRIIEAFMFPERIGLSYSEQNEGNVITLDVPTWHRKNLETSLNL